MTADEIAKCIPKEVLLAVAGAMSKRQSTRAALAAGLAAWPGAFSLPLDNFGGAKLILPLQEPRSE